MDDRRLSVSVFLQNGQMIQDKNGTRLSEQGKADALKVLYRLTGEECALLWLYWDELKAGIERRKP